MSKVWSFRREQLECYLKPYMQKHGIKSRTTALVKMLEERKTLKQDNEKLQNAIEMLLPNGPENLSEDRCKFLIPYSDGKLVCRNKKAPLDTHDLTLEVCNICSAYEPKDPLKTNLAKSQSTSIQKPRHVDYAERHDMTKRLQWIRKYCLRRLRVNDDSYCHNTCSKLLDGNQYQACMQLYNEYKEGKHPEIRM